MQCPAMRWTMFRAPSATQQHPQHRTRRSRAERMLTSPLSFLSLKIRQPPLAPSLLPLPHSPSRSLTPFPLSSLLSPCLLHAAPFPLSARLDPVRPNTTKLAQAPSSTSTTTTAFAACTEGWDLRSLGTSRRGRFTLRSTIRRNRISSRYEVRPPPSPPSPLPIVSLVVCRARRCRGKVDGRRETRA